MPNPFPIEICRGDFRSPISSRNRGSDSTTIERKPLRKRVLPPLIATISNTQPTKTRFHHHSARLWRRILFLFLTIRGKTSDSTAYKFPFDVQFDEQQ
jgi:hypothetical protein